MRTLIVFLILMFGRSLWTGLEGESQLQAQVFELSAGTSTLYQADGGRLTVRGGSYAGSVGMGTVGGRVVGGAQLLKSTERATYTLGSHYMPFNLPTDIFDSDHYLTGIGASIETTSGALKIFSFAGGTSTTFNSPFFDGAMFNQPAVVVLLHEKIGRGWTASTAALISKQVTALHSFAWESAPELHAGIKMAISAGLGASEWYGATSFEVYEPKFDVKASYVEAGENFRRADVAMPQTSEPVRENVQLNVRPDRHFSLSVGRQNYLTPVLLNGKLAGNGQNIRSSVNQVSGNLQLAGCSFSAMGFESFYSDRGNVAMSLSGSREIGPQVKVQGTYLSSRPTEHTDGSAGRSEAFITNVQEMLTPRWSVSQTVNRSNGQNTIGFGGSFLSNIATLSADYQTYYVPARTNAPFQQALMLNAQVHLFGVMTLNAGTYVGPDGHLFYTTEVDGSMVRRSAGEDSSIERNAMGLMVLDGRVVDTSGEPVMGAALLIDQSPVYTNSAGYFLLRERRAHTHPLKVLGDHFLDGYFYRVVSAPAETRSGMHDVASEMLIVVERLGPETTAVTR